ncbi:MAG: E3 binding domain-containing protein [Acidimicrobiales bacterium]
MPEPEPEPAPAPEPVTAPPVATIVPASPPARKLARERAVDLATITPTGSRGQVTPADVELLERPSALEDTKRRSVRRATPTS